MKIRSRGLGKRELLMDLNEFEVEREGGGIVLKGVTHAPISWETTVAVGPEDIGSLLKMVFKPAVLRMAVRWALHMKGGEIELAAPERPARLKGTSALRAETVVTATGAGTTTANGIAALSNSAAAASNGAAAASNGGGFLDGARAVGQV